jgi:hypothetical protein
MWLLTVSHKQHALTLVDRRRFDPCHVLCSGLTGGAIAGIVIAVLVVTLASFYLVQSWSYGRAVNALKKQVRKSQVNVEYQTSL